MKFGIKILICNLIVLLLLFGVGGGLLVWHSYRLAVDREIENGLEENHLLRSAMEISMLKYVSMGMDDEDAIMEAAVKDMVYGIEGTQAMVFLLDRDGALIFDHGALDPVLAGDAKNENKGTSMAGLTENMGGLTENMAGLTESMAGLTENMAGGIESMAGLTDNLARGKKSYEIRSQDGRYFLYTAGQTDFNRNIYYLITARDIQGVYENIQNQLNYYRFVLLALVLTCSVLLFFMLRFLTRSIRELDRSTEQIMNGDYSIQVKVRSNDEIGALGEKFNRMASAIAEHIHKVEEEGRRREEFVANFTHELKTPMTNMIGYADMIRSKELPKELRFEAANYIVEEGLRLEKMSARLFDLFIAKNEHMTLCPVHVPELLEEVHKSVEPLLVKKRLELKVNTEDLYILGDKEMLRSVFINFMDNAIKASEFDTTISVDGHCIGANQVRLEITDQGCGIPESEIEKIKEAFYMVDKSRARKAGGAGLGVALASKVLELHHVQWKILSEPDIGTSIIMDFKEGKAYEPLA